MTQLIKYSLAVFVISLSLSANAATTRNLSTNKQATATTSQYRTQMNKTRTAMKKMQEEDFQHFIKALKNNPPADQLPADAQKRRSMMIKRLQAQHAFMIKTRKQHQREFKNHFHKRVNDARTAMEKMQEQDFQRYIKALKNNPPANQLPADAQKIRSMMIKRLQAQHAFMIRTRKQYQLEARKNIVKSRL